MSDTYSVTVNGEEYEVDAGSIQEARAKAQFAASKAAKAGGVPRKMVEAGMTGEGGGSDISGSAAGRFVGGVWKNVNPVSMATGLWNAFAHPIDTTKGAVQAMGDEWEKAGVAALEGRYSEAAGHGMAGSIPFIGPAAAAAGERIGTEDVAGGLGEGVGLLLPAVAPKAVRAVLGSGRAPVAESGAAQALRSGAASRVVEVMSPTVGANKTRFGNSARKIAPQLAEELVTEGAPLTKGGFHSRIKMKLAEATDALDEAADARLAGRTFNATDILKALEEKRARLVSKPVEGKPVVPGPNSARVAVIDQAIDEINRLKSPYGEVGGPQVTFDAIKTMRQAYDGQAKVVYSPSLTADFLKQKGAAFGAADITDVLRQELAQWDPATAGANARYSLYKAADDVMTAAAEVERVRPKVGRHIMARLTGLLGGQHAAGLPGAVAGYIGAPIIDSVLQSGMTTKLKAAALMGQLAKAIETGDLGAVNSISHSLERLGMTATASAAQANRASMLTTETAPGSR